MDSTFVVHPSTFVESSSSSHAPSCPSSNSSVTETSTQVLSSPLAQSVSSSPVAPPFSPLLGSLPNPSPVSTPSSDRLDIPVTPPQSVNNLITTSSPQTLMAIDLEHSVCTQCVGYKLVGDNIDRKVKSRYMRSERQTKSLHYFHSYAIRDRVSLTGLSDIPPFIPQRPYEDLVRKLLPSKDDSEVLHIHFETHVARILVNNLPFMKCTFDDVVDWHIQHQHSKEMSQKSQVVSTRLFALKLNHKTVCIHFLYCLHLYRSP